MNDNKLCSKCNEQKNIIEFEKRENNKYRSECKICRKKLKSQYYQNNKEKIIKKSKKYREINKENIKRRTKEFYLSNKEKKKEYNKEYRIKNQDKLKANSKKYYENNKEILKEKAKEHKLLNADYYKEYNCINWRKYSKSRNKDTRKLWYKNNKNKINKQRRSRIPSSNNKFSDLVRDRIRHALKSQNGEKCLSSIKLLGCSIKSYRDYLESKFTKGMTWENHGLYGWHIDHVRCCASFDLSDPEQQKLCFNYTNTQPLWGTTAIAMKYGEGPEYIGNLEKSYNL